MVGRLTGKVALITGAGSGIGKATAVLFAAEGAAVVVADFDESAGRATVEDIVRESGTASFIRVNVTRSEEIRQMIAFACEKYGRLDVLHNNAGIRGRGSVEEISENDWRTVLDVNLTSVFLGCKHAIPVMKAQGGGVIINTASAAGVIGTDRNAAYCAAKGGVVLLTKQLQVDYAPLNIRVNAICPAAVDTPLMGLRFAAADDEDAARAAYVADLPMNRMLMPEEIARIALFLAADGLPYAPVPYIQ
jgi:NAD(P)-dependent dehydrogenase (short-subunit alcohol dehydrogenase family)